GLLELVLGGHPGRGVAAVGLLAGGDDQVAVAVQRGVLPAVGVVLQLAVTPAVVAELVVPVGRVRRGAGGAVELVGPDQVAGGGGAPGGFGRLGRCGLRGGEPQGDQGGCRDRRGGQ